MAKFALSIVFLALISGCMTRERVVVVDGPVPGYQGFYPSSNQASYRVYPDYRQYPVQQATTPAYIPPPDLGPRPPVVYYAAPPVVYSPPPQVVYTYPTVYPAYGTYGPSPYYPRSTYVYRTYNPGWGWGNAWSQPYHHSYSTPYNSGYRSYSAPIHHGYGYHHSYGHSGPFHHHHR